MLREAALSVVLVAVIVGMVAGVLLLTQPESRASITGLMVDGIDCEVENCVIISGASMMLSVGIQGSEMVENAKVQVWGIWSSNHHRYQIDESRIVSLEAGEHGMENFETTAYCSSCAGITPGPYEVYAEISVDGEVLDNYKVTIYPTGGSAVSSITGLMVGGIDCEVENCIIESGASMVLSVGIQGSTTVENLKVHAWGIWSPNWHRYQIDESRSVRLEAGEHRTENFKIKAYCSSCAGITPGPYEVYAEISVDGEVLDNFEITIYLASDVAIPLITEFMVNGMDCKVENCIVESGTSMMFSVGIQLSVGIQVPEVVENLEVHVWGIWSQRHEEYKIDESRVVSLGAGEHRMENFETTAYCSSCAGIEPGPYEVYANISFRGDVFDESEMTIYLID